MSLEYAILGFLSYGPSTGYDLKRVFDSTVRHFWPADQSQIYRTLNRLGTQGYVGHELVEQEEKPDRKIYHLTEAGREEFLRWLATPHAPDEVREGSLIQVFFAARLPNEEIIRLAELQAEQTRERLQTLEALKPLLEEHAAQIGTRRDVFFWELTLEHGLAMTRAGLKWIESVIRRLKTPGNLPEAD
ncbi:MAG: PadR family transcriptional regulator [Candidatus Eisenbacteria bacterium]|jgi:DNA-binding PadR family transcriptional regulator|nr:PadR family transcriptional regulator [Candidatus Eisenbacteria bacterium]